MTKLHLISKPITFNQLKIEIDRLLNKNDEILFIGDAVISLMDKEITVCLEQLNIQYYGLAADCLCRGISTILNQPIKQISDNLMVDLTIKHQQTISW